MREPQPDFNSLTHEVIGAAIEVHRELGPGFLESIYEEALCAELRLRSIEHERQSLVKVAYKGHAIGDLRLDLLVRRKLVVELKAVEALLPVHSAQVIAYLRATGLHLGLLINFNVPALKDGVRRIVLS